VPDRAYLKIALRVLLSAAQRGIVPPGLLALAAETIDARTQDSELTELIRQINQLPGSQQADGSHGAASPAEHPVHGC
jgi:hypothetical protein